MATSDPLITELERPPRPVGITLLAFLLIVTAPLVLVLTFAIMANMKGAEPAMRAAGLGPIAILAGAWFLAALGFAAGLGMWRGTTWGWWLGAFYYVYGVARNLSAIGFAIAFQDKLAGERHGLDYLLFKHGVRSLFYAWIVWYFFKPHVLAYFRQTDIQKSQAIGKLVKAVSLVGLVFSALLMLQ